MIIYNDYIDKYQIVLELNIKTQFCYFYQTFYRM